MLRRDDLPNNIDQLKDIIVQQAQEIEQLKSIVAAQQETIKKLEIQVRYLSRQLFGRKSEKLQSPPPLSELPEVEEVMSELPPPANKNRSKGGRRKIPAHLRREQIEHDLPDSEKYCPECHQSLSCIGSLTSEQLEFIPSQLHVLEHIRHKYACSHCQGHVKTAEMPAQAIDKGFAGPGLLSEIIINKYQDHLPLYRQEQRFERHGLNINRSTLCGWLGAIYPLVQALVDSMKEDLLQSHHLFTDDTIIPVQAKEKTKTSRLWVYISPGNQLAPACTVYDYTATRSRDGPLSFLSSFKGYLQADAYSGYDRLYLDRDGEDPSIIEVCCLAHARRKFYDIGVGQKKPKLVLEALGYIGKLYDIEQELKIQDLLDDEIKAVRQSKSIPILKAFKLWLDEKSELVLPKSQLGKAISYTLNHWAALTNYTREGFLEIDNNRAERSIKPLVIGRKNYLFAGNDTGAKAAAAYYSLIETCKQNNINTFDYLRDVLTRIGNHPNSKIKDLLPYNWKIISDTSHNKEDLKLAA